MAPMPLSPGAKLKVMTPSQSHSPQNLPASTTSSSAAEKVGTEAATCDSTETTTPAHMTNGRNVVSALNGSNNLNNKSNNNNNNKNNNNNNISEKLNTAMTKPTAQKQQHNSNDFITNFFNNLKSTMQQQQQQQKQKQQKLASDNKDALYRQTTAPVTKTALTKAATPAPTPTPTARCDSSSNNNGNVNKCEASEVDVAAVVIKTEVDAAANHDDIQQQQQQKQEKQQQMSPTSISSSTSATVTSSTVTSSSSSTSAIAAPATAPSAKTTTTTKATKSSHSPHVDKENQSLDANNDDSDDNLIFAKPLPVLLSAVNPHIICNLCHGYLIDATTIVECLHSFCHSCIMRHLRTEQYCPRCEMMINTAKPNIKSDTTLQAIVYKLVPGLYEKELMRKRAFYKDKPVEAAMATPEQRGDDTEHLIFSPSEYMSLSLEYADIEEHIGLSTNSEFAELLKPKFLQCPSICTVAHLKKFVYGKFDIDTNLFAVDIMYKVKTIVLLDHYTLMDVAYIYTWKRDAPMRFYFRVRETPPKPIVKKRKPPPPPAQAPAPPVVETKQEVMSDHEEQRSDKDVPRTPIVQQAPATSSVADVLPVTEIKQEKETDPEPVPTAAPPSPPTTPPRRPTPPTPPPATTAPAISLPHPIETKTFEIVPSSNLSSSSGSSELSKTDKLKITIVTKGSRDKREVLNGELISPVSSTKHSKEKDKRESSTGEAKEERKVENIKLKIDLSKQNSVTIINMSDPERREIVKPVKPEREWKVKTKKDKGDSPKSSPSSERERKRKTPSPLTVPPLTIKAERISPLAKTPPKVQSPNVDSSSSITNTEEEQKSQFLKSFALAPIKDVKQESPEKSSSSPPKHHSSKPISPPKLTVANSLTLMRPPSCLFPKPVTASKRKSKEPLKALPKKPKFAYPLPTDDFKIKLPPSPHTAFKPAKPLTPPPQPPQQQPPPPPSTTPLTTAPAGEKETNADKLMPPPAPLACMRPPTVLPKKPHKHQNKFAPPGSLTPHPSNQAYQPASPGNRTPIAKRYQPILPKAARPNPFANIPSDVNKILKDAGTEIKSISSSDSSNSSKIVYGPKTPQKSSMGPPPTPLQSSSTSSSSNGSRNNPAMGSSNKSNGSNNYLNLALFNSSKSKGNEVPPGCRTPMYSPNSPIYSPSSPQYTPNYNIPTVPTYKYTPKPSSANSSYFQNVLGNNNQLSSLFPAPPTKKPENTPSLPRADSPLKPTEPTPKRVYPFAKSPSPVEDPPEKQLKVKSLLTSCNINIPSSLSITITREDGESQQNSAAYPKHKSPVNNYIEILKLPDQPVESSQKDSNKRPSPPKQTPAPMTKKENNNNTQPPQNRINPAQNGNGINSKTTSNTPPKNMNYNFTKPPVTIHSINSNHGTPVGATTVANNTKSSNQTNAKTTASLPPTTNSNVKHQMPPPTANLLKTPTKLSDINNGIDKKTPSPEKRPPSNLSDPNSPSTNNQGENKSPKSPNSDAQAAKKFRHILPRQNPTPISEVIPPKVTAGNIIGTYSSPSGVAVKVHANKKVPPSKKSPNGIAPTPQNVSTNSNKAPLPKSSPNSALPLVKPPAGKTSSPKSSPNQTKNPIANKPKKPVTTNNNSQPAFNPISNTPTMPTPNALNKLVPTSHATLNSMPPSLPPLQPPPTHGIQPHPSLPNVPAHLGVPNQAELGQFLKDNLLRAQAQAAAANQSNMFYNYANAAAQMGQFAPSMYANYQQAYIMDQLSRMQRAGNEAFVEYMQKLKSVSVDKALTGAAGESEHSVESRSLPTTKPSSPKTATTQAIPTTSNNSQKTAAKMQQPTAKTK